MMEYYYNNWEQCFIVSLLRVPPGYALLAAQPALFLRSGGAGALALRRVFPDTFSVLPLLRDLQRVARLLFREAPGHAFRVDRFGSLAIGL